MNKHATDQKLIHAIKSGQQGAFNLLMIRYQNRIFKIVSRFIKDPSEALDVCQETFLKAYRALPSFRGESSFYTWIYRIAVNTAKNYALAEAKKNIKLMANSDDTEQLVNRYSMREQDTPEQFLICNEVEKVIFSTIDSLPAELKSAILLREIEGLSYEEIALIMDCPVGTIRSRIFRARECINKSMHDMES